MLTLALLLIGFAFLPFAKVYANPGTETLRPMGVGTTTQLSKYPSSQSYNWECVDEETADEDVTYVYRVESGFYTSSKYDTYAIQDHSLGSGTINSVTIYIRCRMSDTPWGTHWAKTVIRTHDNNYYGNQNNLGTSYVNYYTQYSTNPYTTSAWTWSEVDAMEAGVQLAGDVGIQSRCTQVWVVVDYTPQVPEFPYGELAVLAIGFAILLANTGALRWSRIQPRTRSLGRQAFWKASIKGSNLPSGHAL
ncbi:MAG: hypothetical protein JTT11_08310 [Candidatus Brockarchaeota archaeon]|nr:hypothetical protein [Candidatus Brockarchaeota archaeon]